jgi:hypothetical protein
MKIIERIKSYLSTDFCKVQGEEIKSGFKTNTKVISGVEPTSLGITHGDRKRYFGNYNQDLANRISEIKSSR